MNKLAKAILKNINNVSVCRWIHCTVKSYQAITQYRYFYISLINSTINSFHTMLLMQCEYSNAGVFHLIRSNIKCVSCLQKS